MRIKAIILTLFSRIRNVKALIQLCKDLDIPCELFTGIKGSDIEFKYIIDSGIFHIYGLVDHWSYDPKRRVSFKLMNPNEVATARTPEYL